MAMPRGDKGGEMGVGCGGEAWLGAVGQCGLGTWACGGVRHMVGGVWIDFRVNSYPFVWREDLRHLPYIRVGVPWPRHHHLPCISLDINLLSFIANSRVQIRSTRSNRLGVVSEYWLNQVIGLLRWAYSKYCFLIYFINTIWAYGPLPFILIHFPIPVISRTIPQVMMSPIH